MRACAESLWTQRIIQRHWCPSLALCLLLEWTSTPVNIHHSVYSCAISVLGFVCVVNSLSEFLYCLALWPQRNVPLPIHHVFHIVYCHACDLILAAPFCTCIKAIEYAAVSSLVKIKGWDGLSKLMPEAPQINVPSYLLIPASHGAHCNILDNPSNSGWVK